MLELTSPDQMEHYPSPRILNTHYVPPLLPRQMKDTNTKIVFIYRNPKDVAVSLYHHLSTSLSLFGANVGDLNTFISGFLKDQNGKKRK